MGGVKTNLKNYSMTSTDALQVGFLFSLTIVNEWSSLMIVNEGSSLTIGNEWSSLTIVNEGSSSTIVNETTSFRKTIIFKNDRFKNDHFYKMNFKKTIVSFSIFCRRFRNDSFKKMKTLKSLHCTLLIIYVCKLLRKNPLFI